MKNFKLKSQKGVSDLPVIFVALGAAFSVMVLVALFLVYLPNRKVMKILKAQDHDFQAYLIDRQEIANNIKIYQEKMEQTDRHINRLGKDFLFRPRELKKQITDEFLKRRYYLKDFHLGTSLNDLQGPLADRMHDHFWVSYPIDFSVTGSRKRLESLIRNWRTVIPLSLRLQEVDIKQLKMPWEVSVVFQMLGHFLIPLEEKPVVIHVKSVHLPAPGFFESSRMRRLRISIQEQEVEINRLNKVLGTLSQIHLRKKRLQSLLFRKAKFAGMREQEFDLLEQQLRSALPRADEEGVQRILIRVEETDVTEKTEE